MNYLSRSGFSKKRFGACRVIVREDLDNDIARDLASVLQSDLKGVTEGRKLTLSSVAGRPVVVKTTVFRHRNNRFKATFGIKRHGAYDRSVAEIHNQKGLLNCSHVPAILGYGYRRNRLGMVVSTTMVTEYVADACNLIEFVERHPDRLQAALHLAFDTIRQHLHGPWMHLDLWGGNMLLNPALSKSWIIDVEYFKFSPKGSFESKLGFCLGYLHYHTLSRYISLHDYSEIVGSWLTGAASDIDLESTLSSYNHAAQNKISRRQRLESF